MTEVEVWSSLTLLWPHRALVFVQGKQIMLRNV